MRFGLTCALLVLSLTSQAEDGKCVDGPDYKFKLINCSVNTSSRSAVESICLAEVTYFDIEYKAIQIQIRSGNGSRYECLFANGHWEETTLHGCPRAIRRQYINYLGPQRATFINECTGSQGITFVEGASLDGHLFSTRWGLGLPYDAVGMKWSDPFKDIERDIYEDLYRSLRTKSDQPEPCEKIKFEMAKSIANKARE